MRPIYTKASEVMKLPDGALYLYQPNESSTIQVSITGCDQVVCECYDTKVAELICELLESTPSANQKITQITAA